MALFKKLNEQMEVSKTKKHLEISLQEREDIETELIFGNIFEDVYKVTAIGQGGTETSYEYERDSEEAAKSAAMDGFDVPEKNILKIERMDHDKPQNSEPNVDSGSLVENGDMLQYFRDNYHPWFTNLKKRYKNKEVNKQEAIEEIMSKTSGKKQDAKILLNWIGFHKAAELLREELLNPDGAEDKNNFISRFMSDEQSKKEFPENKQRLAVAFSQWERSKKGLKEELDEEGIEDFEQEETGATGTKEEISKEKTEELKSTVEK